MSTTEKINRLRIITKELSDLAGIQALLDWDQQVNMPPEGESDRTSQSALIAGILYDKSTSDEIGILLEDLSSELATSGSDDELARELIVAKRSFNRITKIPKDKLLEFVKATGAAQSVWVVSRKNNDYKSFEPYLRHIVQLKQEEAELFKPYTHPYDVLLDQFEPGMKTADVREIFNSLRPMQINLIRQITESEQVDNGFIKQNYPIEEQTKIGRFISSSFGYDFSRGRIDLAPHPFTTSFGYGDVRITTRFLDNDGLSALFSTMHETGHALYDQGLSPRYEGTSLGQPASLAIHESQSRLWENLVGRSKEFWQFCFPIMQALFPQFLGNLNTTKFYKGVNRVEPSLIRVEADEATYNLHIMLRLELEIQLIEGSITTRDLPDIWNTAMREYLGITPTDDTHGVLQDIHWAGGMIGYFSTYALGNLISVQLWDKMLEDYPSIPEEMTKGSFNGILEWLREHVHRHGFRYDPQDLVKKATGEQINPEPYLNYLNTKYREIYNL